MDPLIASLATAAPVVASIAVLGQRGLSRRTRLRQRLHGLQQLSAWAGSRAPGESVEGGPSMPISSERPAEKRQRSPISLDPPPSGLEAIAHDPGVAPVPAPEPSRTPPGFVALGYNKYVRSSSVVAVEPIVTNRGPGERTLVWTATLPKPLIASRSSTAITRDLAAASVFVDQPAAEGDRDLVLASRLRGEPAYPWQWLIRNRIPEDPPEDEGPQPA
jgi:hypothetical protein